MSYPSVMQRVQTLRENPRKPHVFKYVDVWWADVIDAHGKFETAFFGTLPEAYAKAVEYANANAVQEPSA